MISIFVKAALQCPLENIFLLRQIQAERETMNKPLKKYSENGGDNGDEMESFYESDIMEMEVPAAMIDSLDLDGYLKANSLHARQHQLPDITQSSTWSAMTALVCHKNEGLASLWKGTL